MTMQRDSGGTRARLAWLACAGALACARAPDGEQPSAHRAQPLGTSASAAAPASAPAPSAPPAHNVERDCDGICRHSFELKCEHATECKANCLAMAAIGACERQFAGFYRCLSGEPSEHWRCDEDGVAAIREGFCDKEQEATVQCMEQNAQH